MRWIAFIIVIIVPYLFVAAEPVETIDLIPPAPGAAVSTATITLEECISIALASHPRLAESLARVTESQGSAVQAGLYPNPRIDSGNPQTISPNRTSVYSFGLTQEVVRGGEIKTGSRGPFGGRSSVRCPELV